MCKVYSKVAHIKQQNYFHHLKGRWYNKEPRQRGPWCNENICALLYVTCCGSYTLL